MLGEYGEDLLFWCLGFVGREAGVHGGDVGVMLVPFGGLIEVFVEHGCRGRRTIFAAWRMICAIDCVCLCS